MDMGGEKGMSIQDDSGIRERIHHLTDDELLQMLENASDYQPEANQYAQQELASRGGVELTRQRGTQLSQQEEVERRELYATTPLFLYIPVGRLIFLSLLSFGLYEMYWFYKNWSYLKQRYNLDIRPFGRALLGLFYCLSLVRRIHDDPESRAIEIPTFWPVVLPTGWVLAEIASNLIARTPWFAAEIVSSLVPSFLFLVPVQLHINAVNERRLPRLPHDRWSPGHYVILVLGIVYWTLILLDLFLG